MAGMEALGPPPLSPNYAFLERVATLDDRVSRLERMAAGIDWADDPTDRSNYSYMTGSTYSYGTTIMQVQLHAEAVGQLVGLSMQMDTAPSAVNRTNTDVAIESNAWAGQAVVLRNNAIQNSGAWYPYCSTSGGLWGYEGASWPKCSWWIFPAPILDMTFTVVHRAADAAAPAAAVANRHIHVIRF